MITKTEESFSLNPELLHAILHHARPLGHHARKTDLNLGFGFVYYAFVRALRPRHVLVIGSGYGFSVVCLALGLKDNDRGRLLFVDPAYSLAKDGPLKTIGGTGAWRDPKDVKEHFTRFGVEHLVEHYHMTSQSFFGRSAKLELPTFDLAFIDGNHSFQNVKHDFVHTVEHSRKDTYIFLHDTNIYIRELIRHAGVKRWVNRLRREENSFEILDFPFDSGVALVRVLEPRIWRLLEQ